MKKIIKIDGMSCNHCKESVEQALNAIEGVSARVALAKKQAVVTVDGQVSDEALREAVSGAGFAVVDIAEKRGLFG